MKLIQEIINNFDGKFFFDGQLIDTIKIKKKPPIVMFIQYRDYWG
jgi:hypothetical protein